MTRRWCVEGCRWAAGTASPLTVTLFTPSAHHGTRSATVRLQSSGCAGTLRMVRVVVWLISAGNPEACCSSMPSHWTVDGSNRLTNSVVLSGERKKIESASFAYASDSVPQQHGKFPSDADQNGFVRPWSPNGSMYSRSTVVPFTAFMFPRIPLRSPRS
jgi:hypothetical protein